MVNIICLVLHLCYLLVFISTLIFFANSCLFYLFFVKMPRYDTAKLSDPQVADTYRAEIDTRLAPITDSIEEQEKWESVDQIWEKVVHAFSETSEDVLGQARKHTDKQSKLDKDTYLWNICKEVEKAHRQKKSKEIYASVRKITGKQAPRICVIKDTNGVLLTDQDEVRKRWREHFQDLYNPVTATDQTVLDELPVGGRNHDVPADILREEIEVAIQRLKKKKAPGIDNISAEEIQAARNGEVEMMFKFCIKVWEGETFPQMWKKLIIVPLHKKKDKLSCDNYRGVSLLSHCGKVMTSVILQRIRLTTDEILSEAQAGFRVGRSTIVNRSPLHSQTLSGVVF